MGVSKKFATALVATGVMLAGCGGSLWPSLEAEDPASETAPPPPPQQEAVVEETIIVEQPVTQSSAPAVSNQVVDPGQSSGTFVGDKITAMYADLGKLQQEVGKLDQRAANLRSMSMTGTDHYHGLLGQITARLQRGSTPGNPVLVSQWNEAQVQLETVAETIPQMTKLSNDAADQAAFGQYLLSSVQATYGLSGAVEEDHVRLQKLEDEVHQTLVEIDRLMSEVSQDINRQNVYVNNERQNMTTLSLAIKNGELYGSSLATRAFTQTENLARAESQATVPQADERPLVIIRFDRAKVEYQQALYNAVSLALSRKPTATFDLVAVSPQRGTAAQMALNSAAAKRNAEDVLRTLTDMGVPSSRVQLLASTDPNVANNEVRIFVR